MFASRDHKPSINSDFECTAQMPLPQGVCSTNKIRAECTEESRKEIPKIGEKKKKIFNLLLLTHISGYYIKYKMI